MTFPVGGTGSPVAGNPQVTCVEVLQKGTYERARDGGVHGLTIALCRPPAMLFFFLIFLKGDRGAVRFF